VIAGYTVQDVAVEVHFGKYHDVDSSEAAFKIAGSMAFRNVFQEARPALLEPIVKMEITVPEANVGDVYSDMSSRGGRVQGSDAAGGGYQTVFAEVPLREVTTYARTLSSMTGGQGSFSMDFSHYDVMPANVQQEIIAKTHSFSIGMRSSRRPVVRGRSSLRNNSHSSPSTARIKPKSSTPRRPSSSTRKLPG
jgi:elongation factor G